MDRLGNGGGDIEPGRWWWGYHEHGLGVACMPYGGVGGAAVWVGLPIYCMSGDVQAVSLHM